MNANAEPDTLTAAAALHPSVRDILQFFEYSHLPTHLQQASRAFCQLAWDLARTCPQNAELTAGLRKLLEAKDCAVRAMIAK